MCLNLDDIQEKVGCSTPERPTKKWILGHADDYKDSWDEKILTPTQVSSSSDLKADYYDASMTPCAFCVLYVHNLKNGGAACRTDADCGGPSGGGTCALTRGGLWKPAKAECSCEKSWTGPTCRVNEAFDDIQWNPEPRLGFAPPILPIQVIPVLAAVAFGGIVALIFHIIQVCFILVD